MGNITSTLTVRLLDQLSGPAKAAVGALKALDAAARGVRGSKGASPVTVGDPAALKRSAKGLADVAKQTGAVAKASRAIEGVRAGSPFADLTADLKSHLVGLGLTRREYRALARDFSRMSAQQNAAVASIANPKVRTQVQAEDRARIEGRLRERAGRMVAERRMADDLSSGPEGAARAAAAAQRQAAAEGLRAAHEQARAQREAERLAVRSATDAAKAAVRGEREAVREKIQAAREAAQLARQAEREAARGAGQAAKVEAQAARSAAREKVQAAREAAAAVKQSEREAVAAAAQGARERARAAREATAAVKAAAREQAAAVRTSTRDQRRAEREQARFHSRLDGSARAGLATVGAGGALYGGSRVVRYASRVGADGARENARDYLAGVEADSPKIGRKALDLSTRFPSVDANTFHERLRDTALAMGSTDKAFDVSDTIGRSSVVLQSLKGKDKALEEGRRFFSALDNLGKNQDPGQVKRLMDGWIKALGVEGADLDMGSLLAMARTAKSGGAGLSEKFLMTTAPSLMMDMGPSRLGTALGSEVAQIIGGRATKSAKAYQQDLGMRDAKGQFPAADRDLITSDPYSYAMTRLMPMLKRKGIDPNNNASLVEAMSKAFSNQVVADLFTKMISQREQYDRKREQYDKAPGLDAADKLQNADPYVAASAAAAQFGNALQQLAEPLLPTATSGLNAFAAAMANLAKGLADHPEVAKSAVPAAAAVGGSVAAVLGGRIAQAIAGEGTGLAANALRLGGRALTGAGSVLPWLAMPAGALGGGYFDTNLGGNEGAIGALTRKRRVRPGWRGGETSGQRLIRENAEAQQQIRREVASEEAMRGITYPETWRERRGPLGGAGDSADPVATSVTSTRGLVGDFLLGQRRDTFHLPGFGFQARGSAQGFEPPRRPSEFGGTSAPARGLPTTMPDGTAGLARDAARSTMPPGTTPGGSAVDGAPAISADRITEAREALAAYRTELAGIKADLATGLDMPGVGSGLEARKAELEGLISSVETKLRALGDETIAPKADTAALDGLAQKFGEVKDKAGEVNALTIAPRVEAGGLGAIIQQLQQIISLSAQANASSNSVAAPAGGNTGRVRQAAGNNH